MTPSKIIIKFPTRSRKAKFLEHISNICETVKDFENTHILVTIDDDDPAMQFAKTASFAHFPVKIVVISGKSKNKIDAINRDIDWILDNGYDIIVQTSDDMQFVREGWDNRVREDFEKYFPDFDGCLHYPDGYKNEELITLTIMGVKYLKRDGWLYNPIYKSIGSDDELTAVAKLRGKYQYIESTLFLHNHPFWTGEAKDDLLKFTETQAPDDYVTLERRKAENFGFPIE